MRDAYCVKGRIRPNTTYDMRYTTDESPHLPSLEQGDGKCENGCGVAQGVGSGYQDVFQRDFAAFIDCVANPENL